ncbi:transcriptional regulator [Sphingomonas sp. IBVSS2]|uniref:Rrf2 family transcriptional regulator n=1 Tax=Sphingomonas sp. IBVSS2 TaxID=1985172 RepID=UPI000A2ECAA9|nr:Rrf2 family transcriptional regulator [Sphingomonas sp. IBVSS2]OSZ64141.1 transcriptional regulator [Sphingomonas sp. IBVSS2]
MRKDSRLSRMLHVLLHMARHDGPMTSEHIARMLQTNPVVVRRTMAGLRDAGYVRSERGHGGGWAIAADLERVSLLDVHRAVGGPTLFAIGAEQDSPACAVEQAVNAALEDALREAEALLVARLGAVSLAELARSFDARCVAGRLVASGERRSG